jgi:hypothetical protein
MNNSIKSFIYGIIAALLALIIELIFAVFFLDQLLTPEKIMQKNIVLSSAGVFIFFSAFAEELTKFISAFKGIKTFSKTKNQALLNSLIAGLGFSFVELLFLNSKYTSIGNINSLEVIQLIVFHSLTFVIIGYFSFISHKISRIITTTIIPLSVIHFTYNILVISPYEHSSFARLLIILCLFFCTAKIYFKK